MAAVVPHLIAFLGSPLKDVVFATDAMGAGKDHGGWGVVAADVNHDFALECYRWAHRGGKAVVKLDGEYAGENDPPTPYMRQVPIAAFCQSHGIPPSTRNAMPL